MKPVTRGAAYGLPAAGRWDFGGVPYGLEPLVLPPVGAADAAEDGGTDRWTDAYAETWRRVRAFGERGAATAEVRPCEAPEELYWFRWITGHQVCFAVWRLIGQLLDDVNNGRCRPDEAIEPTCRYLDGYSAMLLYTGSCPRDVYGGVVRPSMRLRHQAFSGSWAPDYWPVRDLVRGRQPETMWHADTGELLDAITLLRMVHDGVTAKLVADGRSLLRAARVRVPSHRTAGMIFDTYFMTVREPSSRHDVVAQLLRRLVAICQDLAANGLYAEGEADELPAELRAPEVVKCENNLVYVMLEVARWACGLTPADVAEPLHAAAEG